MELTIIISDPVVEMNMLGYYLVKGKIIDSIICQ